MSKLSHKLWLVLFCITGLLAPFRANATHVMGADIEWKNVGKDSFEIIVHAYRDCNGIPLSGTNLTYFSTSPGTCAGSTNASPSVCCSKDITPVCSSTTDRCQNASAAFAYGIQQVTITATIVLPVTCCHYTIAWEECCRSGAITTGAANNDFYLESYLNRCVVPADNSPHFTQPPMALFCANQCINYSSGAIDVDRDANGEADSLVYRFGSPQSGPGSDITFVSGYSDSTPLIYSGTDPKAAFVPPYCLGMHLDPATGLLQFKATKTDVTVWVIVVDEYRKDSTGHRVLIGETSRDMQFAVINCPNNHPPVLTGINSTISKTIKICAGQQSCFIIKAFDQDAGDTDKLSWIDPGTMSGATLISNKAKWPVGTFCWSPRKSDIRSSSYTFMATAIDQGCPLPSRTSAVYSIFVLPAPPTPNYAATVSKCGIVTFKASLPAGADSDIVFRWTIDSTTGTDGIKLVGDSVSHQFYSGLHHYTLTETKIGECPFVYVDSFTVNNGMPVLVLPHDTSVCGNTVLPITSNLGSFPKNDSVSWSNGSTNFKITPRITRDTSFSLYVKNYSTGCYETDTIKVKLLSTPNTYFGADTGVCVGSVFHIGIKSIQTDDTYYWTENPGGFLTANRGLAANISTIGPKVYICAAKDTVTGCTSKDSITITGYSLPLPYAGKDVTICADSSIHLGQAPVAGHTYKWTSSPAGFSSNVSAVVVRPEVTTTYEVTENSGGSCSYPAYATITVNPRPVDGAGVDTTICQGASLTIGAAAEKGCTYYWTSSSNSSFSSTSSQNKVTPTSSTVYYFTAKNQYNCLVKDNDTITVAPPPSAYTGTDKSICSGDSIMLGTKAVAGSTYHWTSIPAGFSAVVSNPEVKPTTSTKYSLVEKSMYGCTKSDSVVITVEPAPVATWTQKYNKGQAVFTSQDSSFAPAINYSWYFGDGDSATGYHAAHLYKANKTYTASLRILNSFGCTNELDSTVAITESGIEAAIGNAFDISTFPNPFDASTIVQYSLPVPSQVNVELMDITGKVFPIAQNQSQGQGLHQCTITSGTYNLHPGIYILKISTEDGYATREVAKF